MRPRWDEYFLSIAEVVSARAACTRRKVGAVLVCDTTHRILSTGYNGAPPGMEHCTDGACPRGRKTYEEVPAFSSYGDCIAWHAEANVVQYIQEFDLAKIDLSKTTMYVTCQPCPDCRELLARNKIKAVWVS